MKKPKRELSARGKAEFARVPMMLDPKPGWPYKWSADPEAIAGHKCRIYGVHFTGWLVIFEDVVKSIWCGQLMISESVKPDLRNIFKIIDLETGHEYESN